MASINKFVFALGFFDALHIGHMFVLERAKKLAKEYNSSVKVLTFGDDFLKKIYKDSEEIYLLEERKFLLDKLGIKDIVVLPTDDAFLNSTPSEFLKYLNSLNPLAIVAGSDYSFGKNASGKIQDIVDYFTPLGVSIEICDLVKEKGIKVSSTNVRSLLIDGDIDKANGFLTCPFFYSGVVKQGLQNGHKFGFPTVNIDIPKNKVSIKNGVYVTFLELNGKFYPSVTNVGSHPTFDFYGTNIETHSLKEIKDEYGENIRVYFIKYIRDIKKFSDGIELSQQIEKDKDFAEKVIKNDKIWRGW